MTILNLLHLTLGLHKKSKFLGLISSQGDPIPFLYLRYPVKYFFPNQSGSGSGHFSIRDVKGKYLKIL